MTHERDVGAEGRQLVAEGWYSTSNKLMRIARFKTPRARIEQLVLPGVLQTAEGRYLREIWERYGLHTSNLRCPPKGIEVEHRDLASDPALYRAFRLAGGQSA